MSTSKSDTVTMPRDAWNDVNAYIEFLEGRLAKLNALEAHGVDNWCGYDDAVAELFTEDEL